ncbi:transcriptional regulator [Rhodococcus opacus]|nr:transcriptional regulator [Rhodococcus opacus]
MDDTGVEGTPAITAVAALADHLRRRMYDFIRDTRRPVSRDEAAAAAGISRRLAAFHLDKLVDAGLLRAGYERVGGRRKVGRTPKVYEPVAEDIHVSIPARHPELLADILLDVVLTDGDGAPAHTRAVQVAARRGLELGDAARDREHPTGDDPDLTFTVAARALAAHGFEPTRTTPACLQLRNCPFHPLASKAPELVCGINHAFLTGFLVGLAAPALQARLIPRPGYCCVELHAQPDPP